MSEKLKELKEELEAAKSTRKYTWNAMKVGQLDVKIGRLEREIKEMEKN